MVGVFFGRRLLMNDLKKEKDGLRKSVLAKRLLLTAEIVHSSSRVIQERLLSGPLWQGIEWVALYSPIKNEVETRLLFLRALERGLSVYFPRVEQGIRFYEVGDPSDLQKGAWGILEPKHGCSVLEEARPNGLVVVPGVVFDHKGYRLGYGKGFYDAVLSRGFAKTAGLAYDFQVVPSLPNGPHDQPVKNIVTERREYCFDNRQNAFAKK